VIAACLPAGLPEIRASAPEIRVLAPFAFFSAPLGGRQEKGLIQQEFDGVMLRGAAAYLETVNEFSSAGDQEMGDSPFPQANASVQRKRDPRHPDGENVLLDPDE